MAKNARELLWQRKYYPIVAALVGKLGVVRAAALWVRAERRLAALVEESRDLPASGREHAHGFIHPA